jgi:hypothetical protein
MQGSYRVTITAKPGSTIYSGSVDVFYMLKRTAMTTVFTNTAITVAKQPAANYESAVKICGSNSIPSSKVINYAYTAAVSGTSTAGTIAFTIADANPFYLPGTINVTYTVPTVKTTFDYTLADLKTAAIGVSSG